MALEVESSHSRCSAQGAGVLSFKPRDSALIERKFSNLSFQVGVGLYGPVSLSSFLLLEDNRMYLKAWAFLEVLFLKKSTSESQSIS